MTGFPDFRSRAFLVDEVRRAMGFYHPRGIDPSGGFFQFFRNDGEIVDRTTRTLVGSCRFAFIEVNAYRLFGERQYRDAARHGLDFLVERHRDPVTRGYRWELDFDGGRLVVRNGDNVTYGLSFVVLAHAVVLQAGIGEAGHWLAEMVDVMERRLYEPGIGLYADQASPDWSVVRPYRGQNANMHACEAMLAAYDATGRSWYLDRAQSIAEAITVELAAQTPLDQVWEHYRSDWSVDWDYNRDDHTDGYRPWGHLTGHQTEWAKLLLMLDRRRPADWQVRRARELFDAAVARAWDGQRGGLLYSYGPDGTIYDASKQQWTHAETLAAAAHLAVRTGDPAYWDWYDRIWRFAWTHLVDHENGGWFRALHPDNSLATDQKSAPEPDYHNMGACTEILSLLDA